MFRKSFSPLFFYLLKMTEIVEVLYLYTGKYTPFERTEKVKPVNIDNKIIKKYLEEKGIKFTKIPCYIVKYSDNTYGVSEVKGVR
jgi:hypothetical protein